MRRIENWDVTFMRLATSITNSRSKDPSSQVGCVLVDANRDPVAFGYNGFGEGSPETEALWRRPIKYDHVIHAETNAVGRAAKRGCSTSGCTAYITAFPCLSCAKVLIAAGIVRVVARTVLHGWNEDHLKAARELDRCGIKHEIWINPS